MRGRDAALPCRRAGQRPLASAWAAPAGVSLAALRVDGGPRGPLARSWCRPADGERWPQPALEGGVWRRQALPASLRPGGLRGLLPAVIVQVLASARAASPAPPAPLGLHRLLAAAVRVCRRQVGAVERTRKSRGGRAGGESGDAVKRPGRRGARWCGLARDSRAAGRGQAASRTPRARRNPGVIPLAVMRGTRENVLRSNGVGTESRRQLSF